MPGELFLDTKCIPSNRLIYNNVRHIWEGMFLFHQRFLLIAVFFDLIIISSVTIAQNIGMAQIREDATYPYQTPLFASLDDREEGNTGLLSNGSETILQNATLAQMPSPSSSNIQEGFGELGVPANNSSKESVRSQGVYFYNSSVGSGSFLLDGVPFGHYLSEANGITMHYVMGGEGDPVVLLHGWPQTWYEWRHIMPILVKNNYTVIVPDLRGLGDTSKPSTGYDGITTANDIYQLVSNMGFNATYLVGHDIGAQTAYSYAVAHPNNVSKLAVVDFIFPGSLYEELITEPWWFAFHRTLDLPEALVAGNEREYLSWFYRQLAYNPYSISEEDIDEYVRHYSAPGGMRSGFEYFRAFSSDSIQNNETSRFDLTVPVLAVSGELSHVVKANMIENPTMESTRRLASNVTGVVMPFSGHWIPEEQPILLTDLLVKFFNDKTQLPSSNESGSLMSPTIEDLINIMDNNTLLPSDEVLSSNLSNRSFAEQIRSLASENFSGMQEQQVPQQSSVASLSSTNETIGNQTSPYNISRDQTSDITTIGKQNDTRLINQTTVIGNEELNSSVRDMMGNVTQNQPSKDSTKEEPITDQGTPLSEAIEAITRIFGGKSGN
jgi:pimeloyl-ACP methyl ester carboxylesterase